MELQLTCLESSENHQNLGKLLSDENPKPRKQLNIDKNMVEKECIILKG